MAEAAKLQRMRRSPSNLPRLSLWGRDMKPGQNLLIELKGVSSDKRVAIADVVVDIYFYLNRRQRYGLRGGMTDAAGRLSLTYEQLEGARQGTPSISPGTTGPALKSVTP